MDSSIEKTFTLLAGLTLFALMGVGLFYASGMNNPDRPVLADSFKFYKGISAKRLNFSDNEVKILNSSLQRNENVEKAILTVVDAAHDPYSHNLGRRTGMKVAIKLKSRNGVVFTPQNVFCPRKKLAGEIALNVDRGAKVLAEYAAEPILKNKEVTIVDM